MSEGHELQTRHRLAGAIEAHRRAISDGTATWSTHHQLGVCLSELAESARRIGNRGWRHAAGRFLLEAELCFGRAAELRGRNPEDLADHVAIICDRQLARARWHWFDPGTVYSAEKSMTEIALAIRTLKVMSRRRVDYHQLAIAHGFLARLEWGRLLGFNGEPNVVMATDYNTMTMERFSSINANSLDRQRAYRSHLLAIALANGANGNGSTRRTYAMLAAQSAAMYTDRSHELRARVIQWCGNWGENLMRRLRDAKAIARMTATPSQG